MCFYPKSLVTVIKTLPKTASTRDGFTGSAHERLASTIGATDRDTTVGGMISRGPDGLIQFNEHSGHYYKGWDAAGAREQFERFISSHLTDF